MIGGAQPAPCEHKGKVAHKFFDAKVWTRCPSCGKTWVDGKEQMGKVKLELPTLILTRTHQEYVNFLKERSINPYNTAGAYYGYTDAGRIGKHFARIVIAGSFRQHHDARGILAHARTTLAEKGKISYADIPEGWYNSGWDVNGDPMLHDAFDGLRCNWCRKKCSETYKGGFCSACHTGVEMPMKWKTTLPMLDPLTGQLVPTKKPLPMKAGKVVHPFMMGDVVEVDGQVKKIVRKEGDIWKLPKANSPMWTEQWGYQGSAKAPYIISRRDEGHANGSTTSEGWACACPNFTRHTPRTDCKHILNVKLKEGMGVKKGAVKMASVDDAKMKAFEKWEREQAERDAGNVTTAGKKLNLFGATTRKFR